MTDFQLVGFKGSLMGDVWGKKIKLIPDEMIYKTQIAGEICHFRISRVDKDFTVTLKHFQEIFLLVTDFQGTQATLKLH